MMLFSQLSLSDSAREFLRGRNFLPGGSMWFEVFIVAAISLVLGGLVYFLASRLFVTNAKVKELIRNASHGHGISRSFTLFLATLAYDAIAHSANLTELLEPEPRQWILFARVLALGWLVSVAYQAALTIAEDRGALQGDKQRKILLPFARKLGSVSILLVSWVSALAVVGTNVWGMVAGLGIGGIAIAFAAKDSVENIFGSVTVLLDMPFGVGDWIRVGTVEGVVEEINLRSTRIRTFEDSLTTMPNSNFIKASVENLGQRRSRRVRTTIQFDTPRSAEHMEEYCLALREFIWAMPEVQADSVQVSLFELKETGAVVQIVARFAIDSYREELECRQNVLLASIRLADAHHLQLKTQTHENPVPLAPDPPRPGPRSG